MKPPLHDPTPEEAEEAAVNAESARLRFKQQIYVGIGGAIIFALVSTVAISLLGMVSAAITAHTFGLATLLAPAVAGPLLGLAAVAALGIGCLYVGSHFSSKVVSLDQSTEAKKIGAASKGHALEIAPSIDHSEPSPIPGIGAGAELADKNMPDTRVDAASVRLDTLARGESATRTDASWATRATANDNQPELAVRA